MTNSAGCEDFEVAIEKRRQGALDAEEVERVQRHLESCASCRSVESFVTRTEEAMSGAAMSVVRGADWDRLRRSISRSIFDLEQRYFWFATVLAIAGLSVLALLSRYPWAVLGAIPLVLVPLLGRRLWLRRRLTRLGDDQHEFLYFCRRQLEDTLSREQRGAAIQALVMPLLFILLLDDGLTSGVHLAFTAQRLVIFGLVLVSFAATLVFQLTVRWPRMRRELDLIKRQ